MILARIRKIFWHPKKRDPLAWGARSIGRKKWRELSCLASSQEELHELLLESLQMSEEKFYRAFSDHCGLPFCSSVTDLEVGLPHLSEKILRDSRSVIVKEEKERLRILTSNPLLAHTFFEIPDTVTIEVITPSSLEVLYEKTIRGGARDKLANSLELINNLIEECLASVDSDNVDSLDLLFRYPRAYKIVLRDGRVYRGEILEAGIPPDFAIHEYDDSCIRTPQGFRVESCGGDAILLRRYQPAGSDRTLLTYREKPSQQEGETVPIRMGSILVVDDSSDFLNVISRYLRTHGYDVNTCTSVDRAISIIRSKPNQIDCVVSDLHMPSTSGTELLEYLREYSDSASIKVLMLSSDTQVSTQIELYKRGVDHFCHKSDPPALILAKIERLISATTNKGKAA